MGTSFKPTNIALVTEFNFTKRCYETRTVAWQGRVTAKRLDAWVYDYVASLKLGGCNEHISKALGYIPVPTKVRIVSNNRQRYTMATWEAPAFMAI